MMQIHALPRWASGISGGFVILTCVVLCYETLVALHVELTQFFRKLSGESFKSYFSAYSKDIHPLQTIMALMKSSEIILTQYLNVQTYFS